QRRKLLLDIEHAITERDNNGAEQQDRRLDWHQHVLVPIARDLGLLADAERALILLCLGRGFFDRPVPRKHQPQRPDIDEVLPSVRAVLLAHTTIERRAAALHQQAICRDERAAKAVAKELTASYIARHATGLLCHLLESFGMYGSVGLLS